MPCRVRKEVWLEPLAGSIIRKKTKHPPYLKIIKKLGPGKGVICASSAKQGIVPTFLHIQIHQLRIFISDVAGDYHIGLYGKTDLSSIQIEDRSYILGYYPLYCKFSIQ